MAHALVVALAVELRAENGCARKAAEDGEVKDEQKLIDDGDTAHGFGAEAADHDVIEQADKACDALLHDHRDDEADEVCVKLPVADECIF